jgi:hypothetical protein
MNMNHARMERYISGFYKLYANKFTLVVYIMRYLGFLVFLFLFSATNITIHRLGLLKVFPDLVNLRNCSQDCKDSYKNFTL